MVILVAILECTPLETCVVIVMYLDEIIIPKKTYFATYFMKLSFLEPKLWPFIHFGGHLAAILDLTNVETTLVIVM